MKVEHDVRSQKRRDCISLQLIFRIDVQGVPNLNQEFNHLIYTLKRRKKCFIKFNTKRFRIVNNYYIHEICK